MDVVERRESLRRLVDANVVEVADRDRLHAVIVQDPVPAKAVLAELDRLRRNPPSDADAKLMKDIAFWFV
jgi:hypothetical protein